MDGSVNDEAFSLNVETQSVPTLHRGDIIIMDYHGSHKIKAVRAVIRGTGARQPLLRHYSLGLDLIEQGFAKLKNFLRKDRPRT